MYQKIKQLAEENENMISTKILLDNGFTKYQIKKMINNNTLIHLKHGWYGLGSELDDEFFIHQKNNEYLIYSNETALYLYNLTDRYPNPLSVTTKSGYHLRNKKLKIYYVKEENLNYCVTKVKSPAGNIIYVYDIERTICDIIKNKNRIDQQIYIQGLQNYFMYGKPNYRKLTNIAKTLGIQQKMANIIELYMKP